MEQGGRGGREKRGNTKQLHGTTVARLFRVEVGNGFEMLFNRLKKWPKGGGTALSQKKKGPGL